MGIFTWLFKVPFSLWLEGEFFFQSHIPGGVRFLLYLIALLSLWALYRKIKSRLPQKQYRLILGLRIALYTLLFFMLGIPSIRLLNKQDNPIFTAILVDSSRSMSISDVELEAKKPKSSRIQAALSLLQGKDSVLSALKEKNQTILYGFSTNASRKKIDDIAKADGSYTNIFRSVRDMETELRDLPLASVLMITDGCSNQGGNPEDAARLLAGRNIKLNIVGVGHAPPPKDYELVRIVAPRRVRRNSEVELFITVRHTDLNEPFDLLIKRNNTIIISHKVIPSTETDVKQERVLFTPDHEGIATYTAEIPALKGETVIDNNKRDFTIDIQDDRLPVLYIEGSPRLEYRFLRRAMYRDPNFRVVGVLRLAKDRFYVQGADEKEAYLIKGFPTTAEQLFRFQAVILGDIEASFFTKSQIQLLEEFVRERGGGILMLGGVNSFAPGGYSNTPVGKLLPFDISPSNGIYSDKKYNVILSEHGLQHPVMRLVQDVEVNKRLWEQMPPLIGISPVGKVKTNANLLLLEKDNGRPVLAVQKYGAGRSAAFTSGGSWYWQMTRPASDEFHEKVWKQLIRWLVIGAKDHLTCHTDAETYARFSPVILQATVLGKDLKPVNDANVLATFTDPLGNSKNLAMDWILSEEGVYQCRYIPEIEGDYSIEVKVEGMETEPARTGFLVTAPMIEFSQAGLKRDLLKKMASITGGQYFDFGETKELIPSLLENIEKKSYAGSESTDIMIWDMPFLFLLIFILMGSEWLIRRKHHLA